MNEFYHNNNNDKEENDSSEKMNQTQDNFNYNRPSTPNDNMNRQEDKQNQNNRSSNSKTWTVWLSGILGGLTVAIIGFLLLYTGIIPIDSFVQNQGDQSHQTSQQRIIQTTTDEEGVSSELLSDVAGAVVGVANLQSASLFSDNYDAGTGSGVVYKVEDDRAYVVTNQHVIDGANQVEVILTNGDHVPAKIHGEDDLTDLAV